MLSKRELVELKKLANASDTDPDLKPELIARIMTNRINDPKTQADMAEFVRKVLLVVVKKHAKTTDAAAAQVCWGILGALAAVAERMIDEAPEND